jgi:hypothetical protein
VGQNYPRLLVELVGQPLMLIVVLLVDHRAEIFPGLVGGYLEACPASTQTLHPHPPILGADSRTRRNLRSNILLLRLPDGILHKLLIFPRILMSHPGRFVLLRKFSDQGVALLVLLAKPFGGINDRQST